jgi:hypothetical protein
MSRSTTKMTNFRRLEARGELGPILIRLMIVLNDFSLANDAHGNWIREKDERRTSRRQGARMYFVRMLTAHIFEALEIIKNIRDNQNLMREVESCDSQTRQSFDVVAAYIGTTEYRMMERIRNDAAFHYGLRIVEKTLSQMAAEHPNLTLPLSLGQETIQWHFAPGDRIIDRIVTHEIFKIAKDANISEEADKIAVRMIEIAEKLADFAGYFIWKKLSK